MPAAGLAGNQAGYRAELERHNAYNRRIFDWTHAQAMGGEGVLLSWTDADRADRLDQGHDPLGDGAGKEGTASPEGS
jgi:hypothetical protein